MNNTTKARNAEHGATARAAAIVIAVAMSVVGAAAQVLWRVTADAPRRRQAYIVCPGDDAYGGDGSD